MTMVKNACANNSGFVICMYNARGNKERNEHIFPVGTYVTIEDFDLLDDGLLGIKVKGHRCVQVLSVATQNDELRVGQCQWLDNWQCVVDKTLIEPMDKWLREIFDKYPEVQSLYPQPQFEDPIWVIYRWLELIPVNPDQKQQFLAEKDCSKALEFLSNLVQ
jgi:Lon protease-like protein